MNFKKIIASLTSASFLFSFICAQPLQSAVEMTRDVSQFKQILNSFSIPASVGRITNGEYFGSSKVVVNIQDLHCHPEVQRNISKIIGILDDQYAIKTVYAEGAAGDVDTSWIERIKDKELRKDIVETLVNQGKLTGVEYYSITRNKPRLIKGVEDEKVYDENIVRLGKILDKQKFYEVACKELRADLESMVRRYFTAKNRRFEEILTDYKKGKISTEKYYRLLDKYARRISENPDKYNNIIALDRDAYKDIWGYLELVDQGRKLNYKQVARQLQSFVGVLKQKLPYSAYNFLLEKTDNFTKIDELYVYLMKINKEYKLNITQSFPDLAKFFAYLEQGQAVNPILLTRQERKLSEEIRAALAEDITELEVSFAADFFTYFEDYLNNRLTADDYRYFVDRFDQFQRIWGKYAYRNRIVNLSADFPLLNEFYRVNNERNSYFIKNMLGSFKNTQPVQEALGDTNKKIFKAVESLQKVDEVIIVVTGGFHTDGLERLLQERKISYLEITPNVTQDTKKSSELYLEIAKQQAKILSHALALKLMSTYGYSEQLHELINACLSKVDLTNPKAFTVLQKKLNDEMGVRIKLLKANNSILEYSFEKDGQTVKETLAIGKPVSAELATAVTDNTQFITTLSEAGEKAVHAMIDWLNVELQLLNPRSPLPKDALLRIGVSPLAIEFFEKTGLTAGPIFEVYARGKKNPESSINGIPGEKIEKLPPFMQELVLEPENSAAFQIIQLLVSLGLVTDYVEKSRLDNFNKQIDEQGKIIKQLQNKIQKRAEHTSAKDLSSVKSAIIELNRILAEAGAQLSDQENKHQVQNDCTAPIKNGIIYLLEGIADRNKAGEDAAQLSKELDEIQKLVMQLSLDKDSKQPIKNSLLLMVEEIQNSIRDKKQPEGNEIRTSPRKRGDSPAAQGNTSADIMAKHIGEEYMADLDKAIKSKNYDQAKRIAEIIDKGVANGTVKLNDDQITELMLNKIRIAMRLPGRVTLIVGTNYDVSNNLTLGLLNNTHGKMDVTALKGIPGVFSEFYFDGHPKAIGVDEEQLKDVGIVPAKDWNGIIDPNTLSDEERESLKVNILKLKDKLPENEKNAVDEFEKHKFDALGDKKKADISGTQVYANTHIYDLVVEDKQGKIVTVTTYKNSPVISSECKMLGVGPKTIEMWQKIIDASEKVIILGKLPVNAENGDTLQIADDKKIEIPLELIEKVENVFVENTQAASAQQPRNESGPGSPHMGKLTGTRTYNTVGKWANKWGGKRFQLEAGWQNKRSAGRSVLKIFTEIIVAPVLELPAIFRASLELIRARAFSFEGINTHINNNKRGALAKFIADHETWGRAQAIGLVGIAVSIVISFGIGFVFANPLLVHVGITIGADAGLISSLGLKLLAGIALSAATNLLSHAFFNTAVNILNPVLKIFGISTLHTLTTDRTNEEKKYYHNIGEIYGPHGHKINNGINPGRSVREIITVDFEQDDELKKYYENVVRPAVEKKILELNKKNVPAGQIKGELLRFVFHKVDQTLAYDGEKIDLMAKLYANQNLLIGKLIGQRTGVCRHMGILSAAILERLIEEGYLTGEVYYVRGRAHGWAVYRTSGGEHYVLDVAQHYFGLQSAGFYQYDRSGNKARYENDFPIPLNKTAGDKNIGAISIDAKNIQSVQVLHEFEALRQTLLNAMEKSDHAAALEAVDRMQKLTERMSPEYAELANKITGNYRNIVLNMERNEIIPDNNANNHLVTTVLLQDMPYRTDKFMLDSINPVWIEAGGYVYKVWTDGSVIKFQRHQKETKKPLGSVRQITPGPGQPFSVGREDNTQNSYSLEDDGLLSRFHLIIVAEHLGKGEISLTITDRNTTNGTRVTGLRFETVREYMDHEFQVLNRNFETVVQAGDLEEAQKIYLEIMKLHIGILSLELRTLIENGYFDKTIADLGKKIQARLGENALPGARNKANIEQYIDNELLDQVAELKMAVAAVGMPQTEDMQECSSVLVNISRALQDADLNVPASAREPLKRIYAGLMNDLVAQIVNPWLNGVTANELSTPAEKREEVVKALNNIHIAVGELPDRDAASRIREKIREVKERLKDSSLITTLQKLIRAGDFEIITNEFNVAVLKIKGMELYSIGAGWGDPYAKKKVMLIPHASSEGILIQSAIKRFNNGEKFYQKGADRIFNDIEREFMAIYKDNTQDMGIRVTQLMGLLDTIDQITDLLGQERLGKISILKKLYSILKQKLEEDIVENKTDIMKYLDNELLVQANELKMDVAAVGMPQADDIKRSGSIFAKLGEALIDADLNVPQSPREAVKKIYSGLMYDLEAQIVTPWLDGIKSGEVPMPAGKDAEVIRNALVNIQIAVGKLSDNQEVSRIKGKIQQVKESLKVEEKPGNDGDATLMLPGTKAGAARWQARLEHNFNNKTLNWLYNRMLVTWLVQTIYVAAFKEFWHVYMPSFLNRHYQIPVEDALNLSNNMPQNDMEQAHSRSIRRIGIWLIRIASLAAVVAFSSYGFETGAVILAGILGNIVMHGTWNTMFMNYQLTLQNEMAKSARSHDQLQKEVEHLTRTGSINNIKKSLRKNLLEIDTARLESFVSLNKEERSLLAKILNTRIYGGDQYDLWAVLGNGKPGALISMTDTHLELFRHDDTRELLQKLGIGYFYSDQSGWLNGMLIYDVMFVNIRKVNSIGRNNQDLWGNTFPVETGDPDLNPASILNFIKAHNDDTIGIFLGFPRSAVDMFINDRDAGFDLSALLDEIFDGVGENSRSNTHASQPIVSMLSGFFIDHESLGDAIKYLQDARRGYNTMNTFLRNYNEVSLQVRNPASRELTTISQNPFGVLLQYYSLLKRNIGVDATMMLPKARNYGFMGRLGMLALVSLSMAGTVLLSTALPLAPVLGDLVTIAAILVTGLAVITYGLPLPQLFRQQFMPKKEMAGKKPAESQRKVKSTRMDWERVKWLSHINPYTLNQRIVYDIRIDRPAITRRETLFDRGLKSFGKAVNAQVKHDQDKKRRAWKELENTEKELEYNGQEIIAVNPLLMAEYPLWRQAQILMHEARHLAYPDTLMNKLMQKVTKDESINEIVEEVYVSLGDMADVVYLIVKNPRIVLRDLLYPVFSMYTHTFKKIRKMMSGDSAMLFPGSDDRTENPIQSVFKKYETAIESGDWAGADKVFIEIQKMAMSSDNMQKILMQYYQVTVSFMTYQLLEKFEEALNKRDWADADQALKNLEKMWELGKIAEGIEGVAIDHVRAQWRDAVNMQIAHETIQLLKQFNLALNNNDWTAADEVLKSLDNIRHSGFLAQIITDKHMEDLHASVNAEIGMSFVKQYRDAKNKNDLFAAETVLRKLETMADQGRIPEAQLKKIRTWRQGINNGIQVTSGRSKKDKKNQLPRKSNVTAAANNALKPTIEMLTARGLQNIIEGSMGREQDGQQSYVVAKTVENQEQLDETLREQDNEKDTIEQKRQNGIIVAPVSSAMDTNGIGKSIGYKINILVENDGTMANREVVVFPHVRVTEGRDPKMILWIDLRGDKNTQDMTSQFSVLAPQIFQEIMRHNKLQQRMEKLSRTYGFKLPHGAFSNLENRLKLIIDYTANKTADAYRGVRGLPPAVTRQELIDAGITADNRVDLIAAIAEDERAGRAADNESIAMEVSVESKTNFNEVMGKIRNRVMVFGRESFADVEQMNRDIEKTRNDNGNLVLVRYQNISEKEVSATRAQGVIVPVQTADDVVRITKLQEERRDLLIIASIDTQAVLDAQAVTAMKKVGVKVLREVRITNDVAQNQKALDAVQEGEVAALNIDPDVTVETMQKLPKIADVLIIMQVDQLQLVVDVSRDINEKASILHILEFFEFKHQQNTADRERKYVKNLKRAFLSQINGETLVKTLKKAVHDGQIDAEALPDKVREMDLSGISVFNCHVRKLLKKGDAVDAEALKACMEAITARVLANEKLEAELENAAYETLLGELLYETSVLGTEPAYGSNAAVKKLVDDTLASQDALNGEDFAKALDKAIQILSKQYRNSKDPSRPAAIAGLLELLPLAYPRINTDNLKEQSRQTDPEFTREILRAA